MPHDNSQQVLNSPNERFEDDTEGRQPLRYAVFGDSWASGINWGPPSPDVEFDYPNSEEVCRCRRVNEAWPVQLLRDNGIWASRHELSIDFQACHGAWFANVLDQVQRLNKTTPPDIGFLMIGGNPAGFPAIAEDCVFQFNHGKDYGPEYPDPDGACWKTLKEAHDKIHSAEFVTALGKSIYDILNEPTIHNNRQFRLFIVSYSGLFNHDDPACNEFTFGLWDGKKPKLTRELRHAINAVIDDGRMLYEDFINHRLFDPRVQYLDANSVLAGHRFCERTEEGTIEAQNANAWLYNVEWPNCVPVTGFEEDVSQRRVNVTNMWPFCRNCGWADLGELGEFQRPFHPKPEGHKAIKDFLIDFLDNERL